MVQFSPRHGIRTQVVVCSLKAAYQELNYVYWEGRGRVLLRHRLIHSLVVYLRLTAKLLSFRRWQQVSQHRKQRPQTEYLVAADVTRQRGDDFPSDIRSADDIFRLPAGETAGGGMWTGILLFYFMLVQCMNEYRADPIRGLEIKSTHAAGLTNIYITY